MNILRMSVSREDHKTTACLCVAFLTHGERGGELLAADRPYALSDVTALLERGHAALVGKPKILFLQVRVATYHAVLHSFDAMYTLYH